MIPINTANSLPTSTQVINRVGETARPNVVPVTDDASLQTTEDVNNRADAATQRVDEVQQTQESRREDTRSAVVELNSQQPQQNQDQVELYLSVATGGNTNTSANVNASATTDVAQNARQSELGEAVSETELLATRERQQELQTRIGEAIDDRPSVQPIVDTQV